MNENVEVETKVEVKDMSKANLWIAGVLALIALSVASMPFFYLKDQLL